MVSQLLDIPAPRPCNLRGADFRTNRISGFKDVEHQLQAFSSLRDLALDNNVIESAAGLASLSNLLHLSITNNCLRHCHGLDDLTVSPNDAAFTCVDLVRCTIPFQHSLHTMLQNPCRAWYT